MTKITRIWVYPDFAKKLKQEAVNSDKNIIELTKELSINFDESFKVKKKPSVKYEFKF